MLIYIYDEYLKSKILMKKVGQFFKFFVEN